MTERKTIPTLIVGGGPAGALAAALLAAEGRAVTLIERSKEPQEKLCGDFLSGEAARPLARIGLDPLDLGAVSIDRLRIVIGKRSSETRLPFPAYGISRRVLDEAILERAAAYGTLVRRGVSVKRLEHTAGVWSAHLDDGNDVAAARILLATGKHDLRRHTRDYDDADSWLGLKMPLRLTAAQREGLGAAIELYVFKGFYAGLQALPGANANLCLAIPKRHYRARGGTWDFLVSSLHEEAPLLRDRLTGATPVLAQPLAVARIPYGYLAKAEPDGLIRLGDQAAVVPSFTGDGVAMALRSAEIAANCITSGAATEEIAAAIAASHRPLVRRAGRMARAGLSAPGRTVLAHLLAFAPSLAGKLAAATRVMPPAAS